MKRMVCEMCGSTDLIKQDGVFVCESCGCKYSVEEAKKLMIEIEGTVNVKGTVKIDRSNELKTSLELAESAIGSSNYRQAIDYSNKALEIDSENAKAYILKGKALMWSSTLVNNTMTAALDEWGKALQYTEPDKKLALYDSMCKEMKIAHNAVVDLQFGMAESAFDPDAVTTTVNKVKDLMESNIYSSAAFMIIARNAGVDVDKCENSVSNGGHISYAKYKTVVEKLGKRACESIAIWKGSQNLGSGALNNCTALAACAPAIYYMDLDDRIPACNCLRAQYNNVGEALRKAQFNVSSLNPFYSQLNSISSSALADKIAKEEKYWEEHPEEYKEKCYSEAVDEMKSLDTDSTEEDYINVANAFDEVIDYKDAAELKKQCLEKAETARKNAVYDDAVKKSNSTRLEVVEGAKALFESLEGWRDSEAQAVSCAAKIEEMKAAKEKAAKKRKKILAVVASLAVVCIAAFLVVTKVIIPTAKYNKAVEKYGKEWADIVKNASVGDTITFGAYEQDNNTSNGKEAVDWTVLDKDGMSLLLISKQALDCQQYNKLNANISWEKCSLRTWMNDTFLNDAFSSEEQTMIAVTNISADKNPKYSTNPGNATNDKVFLLSIAEAEQYFTTDEARKCAPTTYARAQGAYTSDSYKTANGEAACWCWLRSPGGYQYHAAGVGYGGSVYYGGDDVRSSGACVRPALWINLGD